jgi:hypothetical protein
MRWLSPPERLAEPRARVRYSRPTSSRKRRRSTISRRMRSAISARWGVRVARTVANQAAASRIDRSEASAMVWLAIFTASDSGFRRADFAGALGLVAGELLAGPGAVGLAQAAFEVADDAFERLGDGVGAQAVLVLHGDFYRAGAAQDGVSRFFREVLPRGAGADFVVAG